MNDLDRTSEQENNTVVENWPSLQCGSFQQEFHDQLAGMNQKSVQKLTGPLSMEVVVVSELEPQKQEGERTIFCVVC